MVETTVNPLSAAQSSDTEAPAMFTQYASEFSEVAAEATAKLSRVGRPPPPLPPQREREKSRRLSQINGYSDEPRSKTAVLRDVENLLKQACDLMKQIDIEVRSVDPAQRRVLLERVKPLREKLKSLQDSYRSASEDADRDGLLGPASGSSADLESGVGAASARQRARLAESNNRMQKQTEMIRTALQTAEETEGVAVEITGELARNRETIMGIRGHISDTSASLGTARGLITRMQKREFQQKLILGFVALVLLAAIALVIYYAAN